MAKKRTKRIKENPTLATCCIVSAKDQIYMIDFTRKIRSVEIDPRLTDTLFNIIVNQLQEKFSEIFDKTEIFEKLTEEAIDSLDRLR